MAIGLGEVSASGTTGTVEKNIIHTVNARQLDHIWRLRNQRCGWR